MDGSAAWYSSGNGLAWRRSLYAFEGFGWRGARCAIDGLVRSIAARGRDGGSGEGSSASLNRKIGSDRTSGGVGVHDGIEEKVAGNLSQSGLRAGCRIDNELALGVTLIGEEAYSVEFSLGDRLDFFF